MSRYPELAYVAANVRRLRLKKTWTQEDLAEASRLHVTYVARVERAQINLSVGILGKLARALGVKPAALLREAKMRRQKPGRPPSR